MRLCPVLVLIGLILMSAAVTWAQPASPLPFQEKCEGLAQADLHDVAIASAKAVAAGELQGPPNPFSRDDMSALYKRLPAFCRVVLRAHPSMDSDITIEVWMPLAGWNGKFEGLANGGFAGVISYGDLANGLIEGYATAGTDTGHTGSPIDAAWALGHPQKIIDFGYRGIHSMTLAAKSVLQLFYGSAPKRSYFDGCSDGGREALMEAQRFPEDYDGILAGAPANYWTGLLTSAIVDTQALTATPASFISPASVKVIAAAVRAACDRLDGVADGILNDPRQCHFDPASVECKNGMHQACLSPAEVTALRAIYAGPHDANGHSVFPGYMPGAEEGEGGWALWITGPAPGKSLIAFFGMGYYSNMVYDSASWDYRTFAIDPGLRAAESKTAEALNAVNPDMEAFRQHGGKLILYHGWNDPAISALNTVNYYESVVARMGRKNTDSFLRLYMVPGMQHCSGGPGADSFGQSLAWKAHDAGHNVRVALESWVEEGNAPGSVIATRTASEQSPAITRPLCPYPQSAKYKGAGDPGSAESFSCADPAK